MRPIAFIYIHKGRAFQSTYVPDVIRTRKQAVCQASMAWKHVCFGLRILFLLAHSETFYHSPGVCQSKIDELSIPMINYMQNLTKRPASSGFPPLLR
ncbi:hypothetical protein JMJ77_0007923, partial [Colletotrichum scovillei]